LTFRWIWIWYSILYRRKYFVVYICMLLSKNMDVLGVLFTVCATMWLLLFYLLDTFDRSSNIHIYREYKSKRILYSHRKQRLPQSVSFCMKFVSNCRNWCMLLVFRDRLKCLILFKIFMKTEIRTYCCLYCCRHRLSAFFLLLLNKLLVICHYNLLSDVLSIK